MSNLLKSKLFLGVLVVAFMFVAFASGALAYTHSTTLKMGMTGSQVMSLQQALNAGGFTVSLSGAGSPGMESTYFGAKTKAAVMAFQAARGLTSDGVVGPMTGAALSGVATVPPTTGNNGCQPGWAVNPFTGASCTGGSNNNGGSLSGGETDISSINVDDADDDTISEGDSKVDVASLEFDVDDADAELVRADIVFQAADANTEEDKPWRVFDKVYIMNGNDVVASIASDDEDAWDDADEDLAGTNFEDNDAYSIRLNDINEIFNEGDNAELTIAVDVASSVDGADAGSDWGVGLDNDGLRFTDGAGIDTFAESTDVAEFSIEEAGGDSELTITQDSSSPDAGNLEVDENDTTTSTIAVFKVKADEDGADVKINDFPVLITVANTGQGNDVIDAVDEVMVVIDGHTYTSETDMVADDDTTEFTFDDIEDDDITVEAGDTMLVTVKIKFRGQGDAFANFGNATTILATSELDENDVEDADSGDDLSANSVSGTPSGEVQTLYSTGVAVSNFDSEFDTTTDGGLNSKQTYTIDFDVTAFGDTFYIPKTVSRFDTATAMALDDTVGLGFTVESSAGAIQTGNTTGDEVVAAASSLTSSADTVSSFFEVAEGETETFHVTIELNDTGTTPGFYHVQLTELLYDLDQVDGTLAEAKTTFAPAQDFETQDAKID